MPPPLEIRNLFSSISNLDLEEEILKEPKKNQPNNNSSESPENNTPIET